MTTHNASISVLGAGSYGTALAITLARNGHPVLPWLAQVLAQDAGAGFVLRAGGESGN